MTVPDLDLDLLTFLKELSEQEFNKFKQLLEQEPMWLELPQVPLSELQQAGREDVVEVLMDAYEVQYTWNLAFDLFARVPRQDLCDRITRRKIGHREMNKALIHRKVLSQWEIAYFGSSHDNFAMEVVIQHLYVLGRTFTLENGYYEENMNMFVLGDNAVGKTMMLNAVLASWVSEEVWQDISHVVYITSQEVNQIPHCSLVDLISKDWPGGMAPIADILSEPKRLVFILEDLDNINWPLDVEESALCSDTREQVSMSVLLASLLQRRLVPGCWFLITLRCRGRGTMRALMKDSDCFLTMQFGDDKRERYFTLFYKNQRRISTACKLVSENAVLTSLCRAPVLCWMLCVAVGRRIDQADISSCYQTRADVFTHFLAAVLSSNVSRADGPRRLALLERLCALAVEGLLHNTLSFQDEDFRSVGLSQDDVSILETVRLLLPSSSLKGHYTFIHLKMQEFCAAIAYMMVLVHYQIPRLRNKPEEKREVYSDFSPVVTWIFGLLNEKRRQILEACVGCQLLDAPLRQHFVQWLQAWGQQGHALDFHMPLFYCLFENQEEAFVRQLMDFFPKVNVYIQSNRDLMVSAYCLPRSQALCKLKLSLLDLFKHQDPHVRLTTCQIRSLAYWRDICSLFHTNENFQDLEICNSEFNTTSGRILCKALMHRNCRLHTIRLSHVTVGSDLDDLFKVIVALQNLTFLSLNGMQLTSQIFAILREALASPACAVRHLRLMRCDIKANMCGEVASLLVNSRNLKKLILSNNPLKDEGVKILCDALLQPGCCLESLVLLFCCLTEACCNSLATVLLLNKTLKHLDLSVNFLQNTGVLILLMPLVLPTCTIRELELSGCFFNSDACYNLSTAILRNPNLRSLELGSNNIGDEGMVMLCGTLEFPGCNLENLGLDECKLTGACCEFLASMLVTNKKLKKLNLLGNRFDMTNVSAGTQDMVQAVKQRNPNLKFTSQSWAKRKGLAGGLDYNLWEPGFYRRRSMSGLEAASGTDAHGS
ncbi:NACHT, LRR and PYD domains-containing protein 11 [Ochotona curzoniae]|uniref:NACHT, LRR and PYD domains-containing protein 11 n=1 Tax=Ochotona curzoniae TaxID=130825 RepID=UPI001B349621|nr:NACHT, LRR and PYD domains-containing protein 11 [Ochotona curzoniae]